ncbi:hypothetical protein [Streptomyces endocoffeicus]|uniref:hypothetical protein n=1 Tax=Streptomyces endocoffeicus TaxID=2898945 RepID=UPI001E494211|nr:hypothetical protein [Streptomyces endocoffeicus]
MRPSRLPALSVLSALGALAVTLLPAGGTPAAATPPALLTVTDPGFEQEGAGWTLTSGAGTATNLPHGGDRLLYLDAGPGKKASQTITARRSGTYDFSAWIATGGPGAHFTVRVNGKVKGSVALPSRPTYARFTISRVALAPDDQLEIAFESGDGWVNADDVMVSPSSPVDPVISSSDPRIVEMFTWSKRKASSWVQLPGTTGPLNVDENHRSGTGTGTYGPAYWAGYAHRSAYYSRDFAHQLGGAAVLGLGAENKSMLRSYAASATAEHRYYPVWSLNFDTSTAHAIDYHGPDDFVREVPATFELVEKANEAYRWSGDRAYLDDPALWDYYRHATGEFVDLHDGTKDNGRSRWPRARGRASSPGPPATTRRATSTSPRPETVSRRSTRRTARWRSSHATRATAPSRPRPPHGPSGSRSISTTPGAVADRARPWCAPTAPMARRSPAGARRTAGSCR